MKSKQSEVVMSFNSDKHKSGGESIEMLMFNGKKGEFELAELSFENGKAKVERNPKKCLHCHGAPPMIKPMMEGFPIWPQQIPSIEDEVLGGSSDDAQMKALLKEIKHADQEYKKTGKFSRMAALKPYLDLNERLLENFKGKRTAVIGTQDSLGLRGDSFDGAGAKITSEYMNLNHCRIKTLLANEKITPQNPIIQNQLKSIIQSDCGLRAELLPENLKTRIREYYINAYDMDKNTSLEDVKKRLLSDTGNRINNYFDDRKGRKFWNIEKFYREEKGLSDKDAYDAAKEEMGKITGRFGPTNFDSFEVGIYTDFRMLLEPLGVPVNQFSMGIDPALYGLQGMRNELKAFFDDRTTRMSCSDLNEELAELVEDEGNHLSDEILCNGGESKLVSEQYVMDFIGQNFDVANETVRKDLRENVKKTFQTCATCHSSEALGAPKLPFNNIKKMDEIFSRQSGQIGNLQEKIIRRIARPAGTPGAMPLLMPQLEQKKQDDITNYLKTFARREYVTRNDF
jgi:hypothetical protein